MRFDGRYPSTAYRSSETQCQRFEPRAGLLSLHNPVACAARALAGRYTGRSARARAARATGLCLLSLHNPMARAARALAGGDRPNFEPRAHRFTGLARLCRLNNARVRYHGAS